VIGLLVALALWVFPAVRISALAEMAWFCVTGVAIWLASAVAFCLWIYRAHANLGPLGARWLRFSPGWAVGWFFVPVFLLWRPYQVMREIWQASDPAGAPGEDWRWREGRTAPLVGWWWFCFLLMAVLNRAARATSNPATADYPGGMELAWSIAAILAMVAAALVTIALVNAVEKRQTERWRRWFAGVSGLLTGPAQARVPGQRAQPPAIPPTPPAALTSVLTLKNGDKITGVVKGLQDGVYTLESLGATLSIRQDEVVSIVAVEHP
jgi:hypothetical protein